eukprot:CAMPEP_0205905194 /NCGR_PEP_ID=MMETSP1325-20131115/1200_1 /ASSEMBLY_ACC=CAM_ASM_000708 /TAXON_ID=236786 /ORGANISM="Florenciella sp., Strain RCC1007" /LENGTH=103 /DNA_ID=CAMNT_0053271079 /DNA_START=269 /DNA_END=580 /DNA_ORIENTATION=-
MHGERGRFCMYERTSTGAGPHLEDTTTRHVGCGRFCYDRTDMCHLRHIVTTATATAIAIAIAASQLFQVVREDTSTGPPRPADEAHKYYIRVDTPDRIDHPVP